MPKRKDANTPDSDSEDAKSIVNVDFDFFDFTSTDYLAVKHMLAQLFQGDAEALHITELTDLVLSPPAFGTTIKTDGLESDPYAFITLIDMHAQKNHPSVQALINYALAKSSSNPPFHEALQSLFSNSSPTSHIGFLLTERLINMPVQVVPPMYRIFTEEARDRLSSCTHLLTISRTYRLSATESSLSMEESMEGIEPTPSAKRQKGIKTTNHGDGGVHSYHLEDEVWEKLSAFSTPFVHTKKPERDEKDAFGADIGGQMMLLPVEKLDDLVREIVATYSSTP